MSASMRDKIFHEDGTCCLKTIDLNFFISPPVCGLSIGVVGPTLLDLKDLVGATLGQISFILMMNSIGSLVGCFFTGFLLDRFLDHKFLILGGSIVQ